ncbi:MAG: phosphate ABC transporter permease PstA [Henriciella sp.]|nr:phosphate ABC transporter permease PstA [Henriciella sp.]
MTETLDSSNSSFGSPEAIKRLKKRHAAERRFKLYGQLAIGIALSALLVLTYTIVSQALPAFTKHEVVFDIVLDERIVAPNGINDHEAITSNMSGFYELVQTDLRNTFPEVGTERTRVRELNALVTRLAVLKIAGETANNPQTIGGQHKFTTALSDDLDMYLKGGITARKTMDIGKSGAISVLEDGQYSVAGDGAGAFKTLTTAIAEAGTAPSTLIKLQDAWFQLDGQTSTTLTLTHLAGPLPAPEAQTGGALAALILYEPEANRAITDRQIAWTLLLKDQGRIKRKFNLDLFTKADSTYPELAGAAAAIVGSLFTMLITSFFALPVGILAAVYLEEFAPKNRLTDIIEVNINNLAAVPSIIFGLLGAAVFLNFFGMPRSVPLVGGLVLGLLVLPTVIIASRAALKSVPPSIRTAALGLGASKTQAVFHHALPLAAPGIMTGAIIAMARALGETAPLLLIGMVAFVNEVPSGPDEESTVLPVLIYKWFSGAERAWEPLTSAVIVILLLFLIVMNLAAVLLRRRFERRW